MTTAPLKNSSQDCDEQSKEQNRWKDDVGENPEVRVLRVSGSNLDQKKQDDAEKAGENYRAAHHADVIAEQAGGLGHSLGRAGVIRGLRDVQRFVAHLLWIFG